MRYLAVKNFETFQHYKDRAPTWIKLYNALLDDYAFLSLSDAQRSHLMLIWLIASRQENRIPYDAAYIARAIHAKGRVDLPALLAAGFLIELDAASPNGATADVSASVVLAQPEQTASTNGAKPGRKASPHARGRAVARGREEKRRDPDPSLRSGSGAPADADASAAPVSANGAKPHDEPPADPPPEAPPPASPPADWAGNWPARFAEFLAEHIGHFDPGHVGRALKPLVGRHTEREVRDAMLASIEDAKERHAAWKPAWFAERATHWVAWAAMPGVDEWGDLTPRGRHALGVRA